MRKLIKRTFSKIEERGWSTCYWAIDIHETILKPNYSKDISTEFYPYAKETLKYLSQRKDTSLILFTSCHDEHVAEYQRLFLKNEIYFVYVNENPEVEDTEYGHFGKKFYMNILLDDKAGFDAETQWKEIFDTLQEL